MFLQQHLSELSSLEYSLAEMKTVKKDSEIFSSLGSGIFVNSKLSSQDKVIVNVGAGLLVTKTVEEALKLVKTQMENVNNSAENIKEELSKAVAYSEKLSEDLNEMVAKDQKK